MTVLENYMFGTLLAIFRLSSRELMVLLFARRSESDLGGTVPLQYKQRDLNFKVTFRPPRNTTPISRNEEEHASS